MKLKTNIWTLIQSKGSLDELTQIPFTTDKSFDLMEMVEEVEKHLGRYNKTLEQVLAKYENGQSALENPDDYPQEYRQIVKELEPVLNKEVEFDSVGITKEDIKEKGKSVELSVNDLLMLKWLYNPIEEETKEINEEEQEVEDGDS